MNDYKRYLMDEIDRINLLFVDMDASAEVNRETKEQIKRRWRLEGYYQGLHYALRHLERQEVRS